MGSTTSRQLPYPELGDPPNVPVDMKELAEKVDTTLDEMVKTVPNSAGRPPHIAGRIVYQANDPGAVYISNGTAWTRYVSSNTQRIQSGMGVWSTNGGGGVYLTFPVPFDSPPIIVVMNGDGPGAEMAFGLWLPGWSASSVAINVRNTSANSMFANALIRLHWIAIGTVAP